jgi:hypothetical protein
MSDGVHVLHKGKVVGFCIEHGRCALKPFVHSTESEDAVSDGRFTVTELHDLLTPQLGIEELGPIREGAVLEIVKRAIFHGVRREASRRSSRYRHLGRALRHDQKGWIPERGSSGRRACACRLFVLVALASATGLGAACAFWFRFVTLYTPSPGGKSVDMLLLTSRLSRTWGLPARLTARLDAELVLPLELTHLVFVHTYGADLFLAPRRHARLRPPVQRRSSEIYCA